jgi:DNA polymerase-3 subunit alpha
MLEHDHEDIIISTACLASPLSQLILAGDESGAKAWVKDMCSIVGQDNVFLEIMPHNLDMQREVNIGKINIANDLGLPYMVTGDVHAPYAEWMDTQSIVRMASYKTTISKQDKKKEAGEEVYTEEIDSIHLTSADELLELFDKYHPDIPKGDVIEGLNNTTAFARRFKGYVIGRTVKLPKAVDNSADILWEWALEGLRRHGKLADANYMKRLKYEVGVIRSKGTLDYFYIVGDLLRWAASDAPLPATPEDPNPPKKRPIATDVRGSAGGCLFSWAIGITMMDPIAWGLKFERFLNQDRVGLPDIDIDIESDYDDFVLMDKMVDGRELCIEYIKRTYGRDHVAAIIAYQTFAPRAVIKAVSEVLELPYKDVNAATESIGDTDRNLEKLVKDNEDLQKYRDKHPEAWKHVLRLEDQILRDSRHAAGILITPKPISSYMPTQLGSDEESVVTAWADRADFPIISDHGFVKLDVLGVKGLAKRELARHFIREYYDTDFIVQDMPSQLDPYDVDPEVIALLVRGLTLGVFQFSGEGITKLLRHIRPDNAMDISVANALFRPGPIKIAFEYGDRKNGITPVTYWHDSLEPILGETLGLMCFQEQAMDVVQILAGFSGADADNFRKIMSKLYRLPGDMAQQVMRKDRDRFIHGCMTISGLREEVAADIFDTKMLPLGDYLFNKSHSSNYALRAIADAHIKRYFPLAFYAALLTIEKKQKKEEQISFLKRAMREASIFDVEIAPPDINRSDRGWAIDRGKIRYGLVSISGMGGAAANEVIKHRPFRSFDQYLSKMPSGFGTDATLAMAKGGAFDEIADRDYLLARTRQWPETTRRFKVEMSCGCKKDKTIKMTDKLREELDEEFEIQSDTKLDDLMEMARELAFEAMECKKHPDAYAVDFEEKDPYQPVATWLKDHPGEEPEESIEPTPAELAELEEQALNVPLSLRNTINQYRSYIEERIFTEAEFDELPRKPQRKGKKHGGFCTCDACEAAACTIGGEIVSHKVINTKNGDKMAFCEVAFGSDQYSCTLFPWAYKKFGKLLTKPSAFLMSGHKNDRGNFTINDMEDVLKAAADDGYKPGKRVVSIKTKKRPRRRVKVAA